MMMNYRVSVAILCLCVGTHASAMSLAEYGITVTQNGIVDQVTGLRWLDSSFTDGGLDELQASLDAGWRIASEAELWFLLSREVSQFGGTTELDLSEDALNELAQRLSFEINQEPAGPWVCRDYGDPEQYCQNTDSLGGRFLLETSGGILDPLSLSAYFYITEVPMYGDLSCGEPGVVCNYEGRALMVRAVPLPGALVLLTSSLFGLALARRKKS